MAYRKPSPVRKCVIKVYKDRVGKWRWKYTGKNGERIGASCESFNNRNSAINNLALVTAVHILEAYQVVPKRGDLVVRFGMLSDRRGLDFCG